MYRNIAVTVAALAAFGLLYGVLQMFLPYPAREGPVEVEIARGMSFRQAMGVLEDRELLRDSNLFMALGRATGLHRRLIPGRYLLEGRLSQWRVYSALMEGDILVSGITVVEGDSLHEIKGKFIEEGLMSAEKFARLSTDRDFLKGLDIDAPTLEGYLYPDTYRFPVGESPEVIFSTMVNRLWRMYDARLIERTGAMGMEVHEVLTLASIIEREAALDSERPLISAVYHNRLRKRIRLQADPTAIYGIKPLSAGVTGRDVRRRTPYNTYMFRGLPPGPIASPGIKSIMAALYPAEVSYIYFVSQNDGSHKFSTTHEEHRKAVAAYRRSRARERAR